MLTIEALDAFGADVKAGLGRCMNNESFYFRMIRMVVNDASFEKLRDAVKGGDTEAAFAAAHALKGVLGNLSLTPLFEPVSELTELFRNKTPGDCDGYLEELLRQRDALAALCAD